LYRLSDLAQAYCREGADELVFLDIFATVENRKTRLEWVKKVCDVVLRGERLSADLLTSEEESIFNGLASIKEKAVEITVTPSPVYARL
jgi:hypothetical protein